MVHAWHTHLEFREGSWSHHCSWSPFPDPAPHRIGPQHTYPSAFLTKLKHTRDAPLNSYGHTHANQTICTRPPGLAHIPLPTEEVEQLKPWFEGQGLDPPKQKDLTVGFGCSLATIDCLNSGTWGVRRLHMSLYMHAQAVSRPGSGRSRSEPCQCNWTGFGHYRATTS